MGHIRISVLPKSKRWQEISQLIAGMHASETEVADIAQQTLQNVRSRFRYIEQDNGVLGAFQFLVLCQSLIEGYSFLSLIRASSVVNRQWTVVPC